MPRSFKNDPANHWAFISRSDRANVKLAIFVHGFRGKYLDTWGALPQVLHQERYASQYTPTLSDWDFLFLGYNTRKVETYLDIAARVHTEWQLASRGQLPYSQVYQRVAIFAHSLGTLAARQVLCAAAKYDHHLLSSLKGAVLFGSPLNGSPVANRVPLLTKAYPIAAALKTRNPQLRMLREWTEAAHRLNAWPAVKVIMGNDDFVTPAQEAELVVWPGDDQVQITSYNHFELVEVDTSGEGRLLDAVATCLK